MDDDEEKLGHDDTIITMVMTKVLLSMTMTMTAMVLLMVGLSGWGFLSWAGLLLGLGLERRGPDIATR